LAENLAGKNNDDPDKIRTKEEMTIDYISNNFYINGIPAKNLKDVKIQNV
jgi:hypothetical protein